MDRGANINILQMPWMTSLGVFETDRDGQRVWSHQCGGSLITNYFVLTAAHCFNLAEIYLSLPEDQRYKMRLGNSNLNSGFETDNEEVS